MSTASPIEITVAIMVLLLKERWEMPYNKENDKLITEWEQSSLSLTGEAHVE